MSGGTDTVIRHHPSEATLVGYAAGVLWKAARPVVAAHLARCPDCRARLELAEAVGGLLLDALPPAPLAPDALRRAMERLDDEPEPAAAGGGTGGTVSAAGAPAGAAATAMAAHAAQHKRIARIRLTR